MKRQLLKLYIEKEFNSVFQFADDFEIPRSTARYWAANGKMVEIHDNYIEIVLNHTKKGFERKHHTTIKQSVFDHNLFLARSEIGKRGSKVKKGQKDNRTNYEQLVDYINHPNCPIRVENQLKGIKKGKTESWAR